MHDIVFINPPNHCQEDFIPLGLRNLYSIIRSGGYDTTLIDLQKRFITGELSFSGDSIKKMEDIVRPVDSAIYAFTVWNTSFPWVIHLSRFIKRLNPQAVIIIGGPLSTLSSEHILIDYDCIDIACRFEGEQIIEPLVRAVLSSGLSGLDTIPNCAYRTPEGTLHATPDSPLIEDLDTLPRIDVTPGDCTNPVINLEAGRGCSFRCYYCSSCYIWKYKPRYKSGARLFSEIEHLCSAYENAGTNPPVFHFEHDNFLMKQDVLVELDRLVRETGLSFKYGFAGRADLITDKNLDLLKRSGCIYAYLGIETGSARMQKITKKNLSFTTVFSAIRRFHQREIMVFANLMYGFPEETLEDLHDTLDMINTLRFSGVNVFISMLSPELNTPVGKAAPVADYRFNESSRYVDELTRSGFKPEAYREIYLNHLYTLNNRHYDILLYNGFVRFWHSLVTSYPMTVHSLLKKNGTDWSHRFRVWHHHIRSHSVTEFTLESIQDLFRRFNPEQYSDETVQDLTYCEYRLATRPKRDPRSADLPKDKIMAYYKYCGRIRKDTLDVLP